MRRKLYIWLTIFSIFTIIMGSLIYYLSIELPSLNKLEDYTPSLASKVYSSDGQLLKNFFYEERRTYVPINELPHTMWQALVAIEDRRFFKHWGLDAIRIVKAIIVDVLAMEIVEGASTITQQLARQLYMKQSLQQTFTRKLREQITAIQIERTYTKQEILDIYLNYMNFGHGSYGVQSAAKFYFDKDARDLKLAECALLVGLLQRPAALSPYVNPERAKRRRNLVLYNMKDIGYIDEQAYKQARESELTILSEKPKPYVGKAPYFTENIRQNLQARYGMDLYTGGLRIETSIDSRAQALADKYVDQQIKVMQRRTLLEFFKKPKAFKRVINEKDLKKWDLSMEELVQDTSFVDSVLTARIPVQAALISIDPKTGHILAMVGGRNFEKFKFNRALQAKRQPGSVFKPFLYTAVIDNGYPPTLTLLNQPVVVFLENGQRWSPHNYAESMGGETTIRYGLKKSLNLISVRLIQEITKPSVVVDYAKRMGITTDIPAVDAIALGAGAVIPIEVTSAYGALANQGILMEPISITRIKDRYGNILEENTPTGKEVLRKSTAYIMTDLLQGVINGGTGARTRWMYKFTRPAAGKTGTTNDYTDAWFVGFTPQIVTGVWMGFDNPAQTFGRGQDGARVSLPIWAPYMRATHDTLNLPLEDFIMPDDIVRIEICNTSKKLANPECPGKLVYKEIFIENYEPKQFCDAHTSRKKSRDRRRRIR